MTNGYDVGVVKLVGNALDYLKRSDPESLTAIALCKYGSIRNIERFTNDMQTGHHQKNTTSRHKGEHNLELNHTHYLMMDDGTRYNYEMGDFRAKLCSFLRKTDTEKSCKNTVEDLLNRLHSV